MIVTSLSEKGAGPVNEDAYGNTTTRFWVLDGATPVVFPPKYSPESDAKYIVDMFNRELKRQGEAAISNAELLMACSATIQEHTDLPAGIALHDQPSFACAMIHLRPLDIEITVLGDCYVFVMNDVDYSVYTDERIKIVSSKTLQLIDYLNQTGITESVAEGMLRERLTNNRQLMNKPEGYYVGTFGGEGFGHARTYLEGRAAVRSMLLCTDGFYKAFELGLITPEELWCASLDLAGKVQTLRTAEALQKKAFGKPSDDATALFVDFRDSYST